MMSEINEKIVDEKLEALINTEEGNVMKEIYKYLFLTILMTIFPSVLFSQDDARISKDQYESYGRSFLAGGQFVEAEEQFKLAHQADPGDGRTVFYLAYTHYFLGRYDTALEELELAEKSGYRSSWVHRTAVEIHMLRGNFDLAQKEMVFTFAIHQEELIKAKNSPSWQAIIYEDIIRTYDTQQRLYSLMGKTQMAQDAVRLGLEAGSRMEESRNLKNSTDLSRDLQNQAIEHFAESHFDAANVLFQQIEELGIGYQGKDLIPWVNRSSEAAKKKAATIIQAKVLIFTNLEINHKNSEGTVHGSNIQATRTATEKEIENAITQAGALSQMVRALSDGAVELQYSVELITEPATTLDLAGHIEINNIAQVQSLMVNNYSNTDVYFIISDSFALIDYATEKNISAGNSIIPLRGFVYLGLRHNFLYWTHEFFHVIEFMAGINPFHGFHGTNRDNFPKWQGATDDELDYYYFHLTQTLQDKYESLNYVQKYH